MSASQPVSDAGLNIEIIDCAEDLIAAYNIPCICFGEQTFDGIWTQFNPGWNTVEGRASGAARLTNRWRNISKDKEGRPNAIYLKAVLPEGQDGGPVIAGFAIWTQESMVNGYGDPPMEMQDFESVYPGNEPEQRYARQLDRALHKYRWGVVKEKASASPPALMVLDLCVVKPEFQHCGIGRKLVQWGLDEAQRRGALECVTEASPPGRLLYAKLGFQGICEVDYIVDEEFKHRKRASNLFMRTGNNLK